MQSPPTHSVHALQSMTDAGVAWRIAGYYGADRYLLPLLGTPWTGSLVTHDAASPQSGAASDDIRSSLPRTASIE